MTMRMVPQMVEAPQMTKRTRRPRHPFYIRKQPFHIQPFFIAPVLPGETLKNLTLQARCVTDPIMNPIIGWWNEHYFFYVKLRDLYERDLVNEMILDPSYSVTPITTAQGGTVAALARYYSGGAGMIDWVQLCRRRIVDEYFRDEGEAYTAHVGDDGHPLAQFNMNNVLDSYRNAAAITAVDVEVEGADANTTIQASEIEAAMRKWTALRDNNLVQMSFEDYLAAYGIRPPAAELHRPELIRYIRDWQYPSNTIDPATGSPKSAVSWSTSERADKNRFFNEPGFLVGLTVVRPKVYLASDRQKGTFTSAMNDIYTWLPPWLNGDRMASMKLIADNVGPLPQDADTGGYWIDIKDLFLYGEQFVNTDVASYYYNNMASPSASGANARYPVGTADWRGLFVDSAGTKYYAREDGVVQLSIATKFAGVDSSPRGGPVDEA